MGNILRIFKRDVLRLLKAPAALVVVVALVFLPSLYTWFNVIGFWNPYENTGNLRVCVANEDEGAESDLAGTLNLGNQIVEELSSDAQLDWTFVSREEAMRQVQSGEAYASFIIPEDFSGDVASLLEGNLQRPQLEYYVNEKAGPVSTKITDTGATTLDRTVNSTFVSTASSAVADAADAAFQKAGIDLEAAQTHIAERFEQAKSSAADMRALTSTLVAAAEDASQKATDAQALLADTKDDISLLSEQLEQTSTLAVAVQADLGAFAASLTPVLDQGSLLASQAAAKTNEAIGGAAGSIVQAQGSIGAAVESGQAAVEQNKLVIEQIESLVGLLPDNSPAKPALDQALESMKGKNDELGEALGDIGQISADAANAADTVAAASDAVTGVVQDTIDGADDYRNTVSTDALPAISKGLSQISSTAGALAGDIAAQTSLVDQTSGVLDQLKETLGTAVDALGQTDALLADLESNLDTAQTDILALGSSGSLSELFGSDNLDPAKIAAFMLSPTELETEELYPLNAYGSAMAPLFTNLTLWIGVFMLMVILKQEVDGEGLENLTLSQRYLGRGMILAVFASLQAVVCCTGNLIIGVQTVNAPLYYATAVIASLTYLSIQYALSVTLQHIGKGLCVILVFAQIPGATGLYPVEMTPSFFQAVYPFFPFTYGINAMRETIAGFYGNQWICLIGMLFLFMAAFLAIGLLLRPPLTNLNRLFARQIRESGILNGEDVQVPPHRYRTAQLIRALADREKYQAWIGDRARTFLSWYPRLKHGAWIAGVAAPVVATLALSLSESEKVTVLTVWLVWLVLVLIFLVVLEFMSNSFERQLTLDHMSDEELCELYTDRNTLEEKAGETVSCGQTAPTGKERLS